jgi:hypothetical protein
MALSHPRIYFWMAFNLLDPQDGKHPNRHWFQLPYRNLDILVWTSVLTPYHNLFFPFPERFLDHEGGQNAEKGKGVRQS